MIRLGMIAAAMLTAMPAAAQTWVEITDQAGVSFELDTDSIRPEGGWRRFQVRIPAKPSGMAYIDNVADCRGRFIEARQVRIVESGKPDFTQSFGPGERRHEVTETGGKKLMELVCR